MILFLLQSEEEEKEQGPHPLTLLLENSKFECGAKSDGYYADSGVGCQAFHYCVSGQKHSMMCPAGTVFHQVHLNCVPQDQDICNKADKFFFVNDYLNRVRNFFLGHPSLKDLESFKLSVFD